jgi:hypothetical protein
VILLEKLKEKPSPHEMREQEEGERRAAPMSWFHHRGAPVLRVSGWVSHQKKAPLCEIECGGREKGRGPVVLRASCIVVVNVYGVLVGAIVVV